MPARLTKGAYRRKTGAGAAALLALLFHATVAAAEAPRPATLRECVSAAGSAEAVLQCEVRHQQWLRERIELLGDALRKQLPPGQHPKLQANIRAWETYYKQEVALLDLTLERRSDGLASRLRPGVISRLLEQREQQLREYLHNLKF